MDTENIQKELFNFATDRNKKLSELRESDLDEFLQQVFRVVIQILDKHS